MKIHYSLCFLTGIIPSGSERAIDTLFAQVFKYLSFFDYREFIINFMSTYKQVAFCLFISSKYSTMDQYYDRYVGM